MSEQELVGEILKKRREERELSLAEVAQQIRIRRQYLEALEEERFEEFPGEAYLKGFLRNYAEFLALDPQEIYLKYRQQRPESPHRTSELHRVETELVEPVRPAKSGHRLLWILLLIVLAGVVIGYVLTRKTAETTSTTTAPSLAESLPEKTQPTREEPLKLQDRAQSPDAVLPVPEAAPAPSAEDVPAAVDPVAERDDAGVATAIMNASGGTVRLQAVDPTGLEIAIDDRPLQRYELEEGAILTWRVRRNARLLIQNPQAVKIWVEDRLLERGTRPQLVISTAGAAGNP